MTAKKNYYKPTGKKPGRPKKPAPIVEPSQELIDSLKKQILEDLKKSDEQQKAELEQQRKDQEKAHQAYLEKMYASPEPWVEIQSWADTPEGAKVELEWNDSFVEYLKQNGISGSNEEQIVQKWVALLLMQINDSMELPPDRDSKFE